MNVCHIIIIIIITCAAAAAAAAEILEGVVPAAFRSRLAYLSGPSFAAEVAKQLPTVVTIAAKVDAKGAVLAEMA